MPTGPARSGLRAERGRPSTFVPFTAAITSPLRTCRAPRPHSRRQQGGRSGLHAGDGFDAADAGTTALRQGRCGSAQEVKGREGA